MQLVDDVALLGSIPVRRFRWENGLEALLAHNPVSPVAAFLTQYTVGSAQETEQERGLAHFFEHMMFRETATLADGDFDRIIAEAGGVGLNAYTAYDGTTYHVNVPAEQLEAVIRLEADRMANLRLSKYLVDQERGAVLGEMHMYHDMPSEQLWNGLMAAAFAAHPYRHPIIGYEAQIEAFSTEDFAAFYRKHYAPNRAVVVVAGGFDEDAVLRLLDAAYGGLPRGGERPGPAGPDGLWPKSRTLELRHPKVSTETLLAAWRTPGLQHADAPALGMLAALLSLGQSAPLHHKLVLGGLATNASALVMEQDFTLLSPALFLVDAGLQSGVTAEQALAAVDGVLADLQTRLRAGQAAEDLERARNLAQVNFYSGVRSNMGLARQLASHFTATGDALYGERLLERQRAVSDAQVADVLQRYLLDTPRLVVAQRPGEETGAAEGAVGA